MKYRVITFAVSFLRCSRRSWVSMLGLQWLRSGAPTDDNAPSFVVLLMHALAAVGPGRHNQPPHSNKNQCAGQQHRCGRCRWSCECSIICCWFVGCAHFQKRPMLIACSGTPASAPAVAGSCVGDIMITGRCGRDIIACVCMPHAVPHAVGRPQLLLEPNP